MKKKLTIFLSLLMAVACVYWQKSDVEAETWQQYLARQWQTCETTFSALDKSTSLTPWNGTNTVTVVPTDTDGNGLVEVTTPEQLRYAIENNMSLELMNDLDLGGTLATPRNWAPINLSGTNSFIIEGHGHSLYNLYINAGGYTAFFGSVDNPNFKMQNVTFRYAKVLSTTQYTAVVIGHFIRGRLDNVNVEDSLVKGAAFTGGLLTGWNTGYTAFNAGSQETPLATTGTYITHCHTNRVYTYGTSCVGNFIAPLWGAYVANCYAVNGVTVSTAGHSGGFVSCPGYCFVENCFCNITMYGQSQTAVFSGVDHHANLYKNCYASGVVEGETGVGGFLGDGNTKASSTHSYYVNCYSTSMVGMQNQASNMGGFAGVGTNLEHFYNCYAAGEVGTLETNPTPGSSSVGGFSGTLSAECQNCFYDKQTSAMKECLIGASSTYTGVEGILTQDLIGQIPDAYDSNVWVAKDGVYPQLRMFSDDTFLNANFLAADRDIVKAYSAASVATALLFPSNVEGVEDGTVINDYDTVRSIRYLFPFTNDDLMNDDSFEISWVADDLKCQISGMETLPIISLRPDTYAVASLAPGIGWTTVQVKYFPDPADKTHYVTGTRRLRLVPTTTLSVATSAGVDHVIYVEAENATRHLPDANTHYDHRKDVFFSLGSAADLSHNQIKKEPYPADSLLFEDVDLTRTNVGGVVDVEVSKKDGEDWVQLTLDDSLKALLLNQRQAQSSDLGTYQLTYKWYMTGKGSGAYLESQKYLMVVPTLKVTYMLNDGTETVYASDLGAYMKGETVDALPEAPTRTGYTFEGWYIPETVARSNTFDETTPLQEDIVVYASWEAETYKITYEKDGDQPDSEEIDVKTDEPIQVPEDAPEKEGYSFVGWTLDPDGGEPYPDLDEKTLLEILEDYPDILDDPDHKITLYPVWEKNPDPEVKVKVENVTHPSTGQVQVKDVLKYTIEATNKEADTRWQDVTITNRLPEGLTLNEESLYLVGPDGEKIALDVKEVYDEATRTIQVPIEKIQGKEVYVLEYEAYVNEKALKEEHEDIHSTIEVEGKNPDGSEKEVEDQVVVPTGGEKILLADPEPEIKVSVENKTHPEGESKVGDELRYTIEVTNKEEHSTWVDVKIEELIPEGLTILPEGIEIEYPDGHKEVVKLEDVYDEKTRSLSIPVGDIEGEETYTIKIDVKINEAAKDKKTSKKEDIGINITAIGKTPTGVSNVMIESEKVYPEGWMGISTGDKTEMMSWMMAAMVSLGACLHMIRRKKEEL